MLNDQKNRYTRKILIEIFFLIVLLPNLILAQELIWKHTGGPMGGYVGDMAINSKGEIYAGVYSSWIDYSGLYKSIDNGDSWNKVESQFDDFEVYSIYITKDDHIWVGTNYQDRIYLSTDNGETWASKRNGYNGGECWAFGQSKDGVLFAGDGQYVQLYRSTDYGESWQLSTNLRPLVFATDSNNIVFSGTHDGLFGTTDNGLTWAHNNFLANIPVSSILIDTSNNIYCGTGYYDNGNGVFYSTDGGISWVQLGLAGKVVLSLAFDSENNLFAGTLKDGLFKTTDMGQTWTQYQEGLYRKQVFRLKLNKQDDIFIGSENEGVFRSINGGNSFDQIGLPVSKVNNIVFSGDSLIFAATPSGVQKYNRITKEWSNCGLQNVEAVTITPSNYLYAGTFDSGLYKSIDLGENWLLTNLTVDSIMSVYNVLAINDDTVFAATEFNLRRSFDGGVSWSILSVSLGFHLRGLIFTEEDNSILATGYSPPYSILYKSNNLGSWFDSLMIGFSIVSTNGLSRSNNHIALADANSYGGLFFSSDTGLSWIKTISNKNMRTIYLSDKGRLLAGALDSIYYSEIFGDNIISIPYTLKPLNYVTEIENDNTENLFFGTYIEGLFEIDIITSLEVEPITVNNYSLSQNYPNPFNPTTVIKYQLPIGDHVQLKVFDVLGREIETLVREYKEAGNHSIEFNMLGLSSGVYIYTFQAGEFRDSKKMLLLK